MGERIDDPDLERKLRENNPYCQKVAFAILLVNVVTEHPGDLYNTSLEHFILEGMF